MKTQTLRFPIAFLLALAPVALYLAATPASAGEPVVFPSHHEALLGSGLDMSAPVILEPVAFENGVATYNLRETQTGREVQARIHVMFNPLEHRPTDEIGKHANEVPTIERPLITQTPSIDNKATWNLPTGRCIVKLYADINYYDLRVQTTVDANDWGSYGQLYNDVMSSIATTCSAAYLFEHEQWAGTGLYVPKNTQIPDFRDYNFNDKLSSHYVVCP